MLPTLQHKICKDNIPISKSLYRLQYQLCAKNMKVTM